MDWEYFSGVVKADGDAKCACKSDPEKAGHRCHFVLNLGPSATKMCQAPHQAWLKVKLSTDTTELLEACSLRPLFEAQGTVDFFV
jgi:hypothetical protein